MKRKLDVIALHYLFAALWSNEMDDFDALSDVDNESKAIATIITQRFIDKAGDLLTDEWTDDQIGHDLWLTRGGHGVGFSDRTMPNGKELADICDTMRFNGEVFEADGVVHVNETL